LIIEIFSPLEFHGSSLPPLTFIYCAQMIYEYFCHAFISLRPKAHLALALLSATFGLFFTSPQMICQAISAMSQVLISNFCYSIASTSRESPNARTSQVFPHAYGQIFPANSAICLLPLHVMIFYLSEIFLPLDFAFDRVIETLFSSYLI
jgi:hypothetical protein